MTVCTCVGSLRYATETVQVELSLEGRQLFIIGKSRIQGDEIHRESIK